MYNCGGDMTDNINKAGGAGTAEFAAKAIEIYCKKQKTYKRKGVKRLPFTPYNSIKSSTGQWSDPNTSV